MAIKSQISSIARRIEALAAAKHVARTAWVWRDTDETHAEALERHYRDCPEDRAATLTYVFSWRNAGRGRGE
jgi:hypothetical protein